jgi:hypothetical protein
MLLIWGFGQVRKPAAQWHDGQFPHDAHAQSARRAKIEQPRRPSPLATDPIERPLEATACSHS